LRFDLQTIVSIAALAGFVITYARFDMDRKEWKRNDDFRDGERHKERQQLAKELEDTKVRIAKLESNERHTNESIVEIKTDLKHILRALADLGHKLDAKDCK
jgi:septal ring factor EnvC (AmiA/AmiB activator)